MHRHPAQTPHRPHPTTPQALTPTVVAVKMKVVSISGSDIANGTPKLTLAIWWQVRLRMQLYGGRDIQ